MPKHSVATGEQYHLHARCSLGEGLFHRVEPPIIGIDQRVIKYEKLRPALFEHHVCKLAPVE